MLSAIREVAEMERQAVRFSAVLGEPFEVCRDYLSSLPLSYRRIAWEAAAEGYPLERIRVLLDDTLAVAAWRLGAAGRDAARAIIASLPFNK